MPDPSDKRQYSPNDLYQTPEFPEDEGSGVVYGGRESRSIKPVFIWAPAALVLVAFAVLALTGVVRFPTLQNPVPAKNGAAYGEGAQPGMPAVSEIMTDNQSAFASKNGNFYDWVELYNPTDAAISLAGFGLSDSLKKPGKLVFPDITLPAHGFVIVFASGGESVDGELSAPFKLNSSDKVVLTAPDGSPIQAVNIPKLKANASYAIDWNGFTKWRVVETPTPGKPN